MKKARDQLAVMGYPHLSAALPVTPRSVERGTVFASGGCAPFDEAGARAAATALVVAVTTRIDPVKALVTTGSGPSGVEIAEVPGPEPRAGQALVDVSAVAVNRGDLMVASMRPPGSRLGMDVAGVVVRAAADGSGPAVGTRVIGLADRDGWAEQIALPADRMAALPPDAPDSAVVLPVAGMTALYALRTVGWLLGRTVLVTGAGGGVGRLAVQLASAAGARVVAWAGSRERMAGLAELGADVVCTYGDGDAEPIDALLDAAGGDVFTKAYKLLVPQGVVVSYGNTSREELVLPADWGHARPGVRINYLSLFDQFASRDLGFLVGMTRAKRLDPQVSMTVPWTEAAAAMKAVQDRQVNGKAVLTLAR
jgi:NADPH2:quinone reductase